MFQHLIIDRYEFNQMLKYESENFPFKSFKIVKLLQALFKLKNWKIFISNFSSTKLEGRHDCGNGTCKKIFYKDEEKKYWCQKCFRISQIPKPDKPKLEPKPKEKKQTLCPECGASVSGTNLTSHMNRYHSEKLPCSYCG